MQLLCGKSYIAILMKLKEGEKASWSHCELMKNHITVILSKNLDLIQYSFSFPQKAESCFKIWMFIQTIYISTEPSRERNWKLRKLAFRPLWYFEIYFLHISSKFRECFNTWTHNILYPVLFSGFEFMLIFFPVIVLFWNYSFLLV